MDAVQSIDYIDGITLEMLVEGGGADLLDEANTVLYEEEPLHYAEDVAGGPGVSSSGDEDQDDEEEEEGVFGITPHPDVDDSDEEADDFCWEAAPADEDEFVISDKSGKVPLDLPPELKRFLEVDHYQVVCCEKLVTLPANPCVNTILETYYREYASDVLQCEEDPEESKEAARSGVTSKSLRLRRQRQRRLSSESSGDCLLEEDKDFDEILRNLRICLEVLHSVRYYVDFTLGDHLLYPTEKSQHQMVVNTGKTSLAFIKQEPVSADDSIEEYSFLDKISMLDAEDKSETEDDLLEILSSNDQSFAKRWNDFLGNDDADPKPTNNTADIEIKREPSETEGDSLADMPAFVRRRREMLARIQEWKLVPDVEVDEDGEDSTPNSQIYGAVHLARLLVKLPEFLYLTKFPSQGHLRAVQRHLNLFINYLASKPSWFSESQYRVNPFPS